jgi:hypothetical protein
MHNAGDHVELVDPRQAQLGNLVPRHKPCTQERVLLKAVVTKHDDRSRRATQGQQLVRQHRPEHHNTGDRHDLDDPLATVAREKHSDERSTEPKKRRRKRLLSSLARVLKNHLIAWDRRHHPADPPAPSLTSSSTMPKHCLRRCRVHPTSAARGAQPERQFWVSPHRRDKNNGRVPHIVDPTPLIEQRLKAIDAELLPRLESASQAVSDATTRRERREARRLLESVSQEHQAARRDAKRLRGLAWFASPRH